FQVARELQARGVHKGDRVLLQSEDSPEWVAAFFGCLLRGAIVVPLDREGSDEFAARVQAQVEPKLLLHDGPREISTALPRLRLDEIDRDNPRTRHGDFAPESVNPSDIAEIIFTSGTTAEPKGVCISHQNILANLEPIERHIQPYLRWERF